MVKQNRRSLLVAAVLGMGLLSSSGLAHARELERSDDHGGRNVVQEVQIAENHSAEVRRADDAAGDNHGMARGADDAAGDNHGVARRGADDGAGDNHGVDARRGRGADDPAGVDRGVDA